MKSQRITFKNSSNETLSGIIDFPLLNRPRAFVLFAHCFTCSKNLKSVVNLSQSFTQYGMAVLRFDFTGLGQSQGDFSDTNFSSNLSDLQDAYHYLESVYEAPKILVGHSLGGAAALHVARSLDKVQAVATIGAPSTPEHVTHLLASGREELEANGEAEINIGARPFRIKKQFLDDLEDKTDHENIKTLKKPLLILHAPQDTVVGIDNAQEIYEKAKHPKSFISLDKADHLLTSENDATYVGMMIAHWALRYLDTKEPIASPEGEVWARLAGQGFATELTAATHHLIADEPIEVGGTDLGPTPYGYLLSALGACTAMTLRLYAKAKQLPLTEVGVKLTHDKIHKEDGEQGGKSSKIDQINIQLTLEGDLSASQRKRLLEIAEKCPVHKTLKNIPEIRIEEAP